MRPSTEPAINTKKNEHKKRWFRGAIARPDLPEFDQILDAYWGGPERRITGLTIRIIGVNAVALIMLILGVLYLSQYQNNLIEAKLETFKTRVDLVSAAITQGAVENNPTQQNQRQALSYDKAINMVEGLSISMKQRIALFDQNGELIIDSATIKTKDGRSIIDDSAQQKETLDSIALLKKMAQQVLKLLPDRQTLPTYPDISSRNAQDYPDAKSAAKGDISFSVWNDQQEHIFLSAAAPLGTHDNLMGTVLLTRSARDIEQDIAEVWLNIVKAFFITTIITIMLSIYLSGVITRPLRKLARSAEGVRRGQIDYDGIPDMSERQDEIGELSIALRQMTAALLERMDSIEGFAADVAHELKNPLTSLRSAVETAAKVKKKSDRDKLMAIVMHDVQRLDRLISDISNASRLDAELSREALKKVELKTVLRSLLAAHKSAITRTNEHEQGDHAVIDDVHVALSFEQNAPIYVWGLEGRIEQVFQNLLTNALSFSPEGGEILISVKQDGKTVHIAVEDQGPGIPNGKLDTVFERFYSQRPEHEDYGRHSGLGLSISKQIIEALGGQIFAQNIVRNSGNKKGTDQTTGARFSVVLNLV